MFVQGTCLNVVYSESQFSEVFGDNLDDGQLLVQVLDHMWMHKILF
jgi:hypothetical protein